MLNIYWFLGLAGPEVCESVKALYANLSCHRLLYLFPFLSHGALSHYFFFLFFFFPGYTVREEGRGCVLREPPISG